MTIERKIITQLKEWQKDKYRKPLIIRGARQVGKTTAIIDFCKRYKHNILLNLEKEADRSLFEQYKDVGKIVEHLFLKNNINRKESSDTIIFIDEIQESPAAIGMLRYFYEEYPEIHVIAAGSLLEFALKKIRSFPVGRVEYRYMHPLNFSEFLKAIKHEAALEAINFVPVKPHAEKVLLELFNKYCMTGGMPEVVDRYVKSQTLSDLTVVFESLWQTYKDDVVKYSSNLNEGKVIKHVINTAAYQVDRRIKFQNFGNSNYRSREVSEAFGSLDAARVIQLIYPTTDTSSPAKPDLKKSPKLQFVDTGMLNHALGIRAEMIGMEDLSNAYKGAIIPHIITQELISQNEISEKKPMFWVREKKQSSAEVDIVFNYKSLLIPVEIKSGATGTLRSLHQFITQCGHPYAVRMYAGTFSVENAKTPSGTPYFLMNLPYFLGTKLHEYMEYFVNNYK